MFGTKLTSVRVINVEFMVVKSKTKESYSEVLYVRFSFLMKLQAYSQYLQSVTN